jgi:hypothetical protein
MVEPQTNAQSRHIGTIRIRELKIYETSGRTLIDNNHLIQSHCALFDPLLSYVTSAELVAANVLQYTVLTGEEKTEQCLQP